MRRRNRNAVIEVSIMSRPSHEPNAADDDDEGDACFICAHVFCAQEACMHSETQLRCCSQGICCACVTKVAKRCKCAEECDAVIACCPFCREIAALDALDVFLGTRPECKACMAATPAPPEGTPPATPAQDTPPSPSAT